MQERPIGRVVHYYSHMHLAALEITEELKVGERVRIKGEATDTEQPVLGLQVDHRNVEAAKPGDRVAIVVFEPVRESDRIYKIEP